MSDVHGRWLSGGDIRSSLGIRLFCLPHAGSGTAAFYRWKRLLAPEIQVCPIHLPGRERRLAEPLLDHATTLVSELLNATASLLDQPYAIFGHSMGSLMAYEWASQIAVAGLPAPSWLFVSGRNAPQINPAHREIHKLSDTAFADELGSRYGGMPDDFLGDVELRKLFLPILRADLKLVETYRYDSTRLLACPISASAGDDDRSVSDSGLAAWANVTCAQTEVTRYPGDHFYHLAQGQDALLRAIETRLNHHSSEVMENGGSK
jgi:medium-chain acyl-[acyl-carrier-protein] hydrolase